MKRRDRPVTSTVLDTLLLRAGGGDRNAFSRFYVSTSARVMSVCRRLLVDAAAAEDTVQDVYLEVWTKAAGFDPARGSAIGWVLQLAHHRAVDRVRTAESRRRRDAVYGRLTAPPPPEPAHRLFQACEIEEVHAALRQLSPLRRQALMYAFCTDLSYQQASDLLGIPLGTFKSRVRDAVYAVRDFLIPTAGAA